MSAQMLSSATPMSEIVPLLGNDMRDLEAKVSAVAVTAGGEVKQNISFVRGETQSKAVEESEAQQVIFSFKKNASSSMVHFVPTKSVIFSFLRFYLWNTGLVTGF